MGMTTTKSSTKTLQVIGIIVAIASLVWGIFSYIAKEKQKELDGLIIMRQAERLMQYQAQINAHNDRDKEYESTIIIMQRTLTASRDTIRQMRYKIDLTGKEVANLKKRLNEVPYIITATDSEHVRMFREWTE